MRGSLSIRQGKCPAKRQKIILKGVPQRGADESPNDFGKNH